METSVGKACKEDDEAMECGYPVSNELPGHIFHVYPSSNLTEMSACGRMKLK